MAEPATRHRTGWLILLVASCAIFVRFGLLHGEPILLTNDSTEYLAIADRLREGSAAPRLASVRMPGYPVFLALLFEVAGARESSLLVAQKLLGLATALLGFSIGRRLSGWLGGLVLGGLLAFHPIYLLSERLVMTETLSLFFTVAAFWFALGAVAGASSPGARARYSGLLFGVAAGAAIVVRLDNLFPLGAVGLAIWLLWWREILAPPGVRARRVAAGFGLLVLGPVVALAPWVAYLHRESGELQLIGNVQRNRVVGLGIHGLLDPGLGRMREYADLYRKEDAGTIYNVVSRLEGKAGDRDHGEAIAAQIAAEQRAALGPRLLRGQLHALVAYLGLRPPGARRHGCQIVVFWVGTWLPSSPTAYDLASWRLVESKGWLDVGDRRADPRIQRAQGWISSKYLEWCRSPLVTLALLAFVGLGVSVVRGRAGQPFVVLTLVAFLGHLIGAGVHAWNLLDEDRYGVPFDWLVVAVLITAAGTIWNQGRKISVQAQGRPDSKPSAKIAAGEPSSSAPASRAPERA